MREKIVVLTEADEKVASGHLKECIILTEELTKQAYDVELWINSDMPIGIKEGIALEYSMYYRPIANGIDDVISYMNEKKVHVLILNLRKVDNDLIREIKKRCFVKIICIDEFGHRRLDCDIIVNPMIDESYGQYEGEYKQKFLGNQYLILPPKYHEWNQKEKQINKAIKEITISMGGVDMNNNTKRIVEWLLNKDIQSIKVNVVLGGGYLYMDELKELVFDDNFMILQNISNLDELFYKSDIAFCAGGNTLHELACIGTPAIVIPTMPHEYDNGKAFAERGFGKCYRHFDEFESTVMDDIYNFFDESTRKLNMKAGKKISDGAGYIRMKEIVQSVLNERRIK